MRWRWLAAAPLLLVAACAGVAPRRPSPARISAPPDISAIPNAVPRYEPRSPLGNPPFYDVDGHRYFVLPKAAGYDERGIASWYGPNFNGLRTATGEPYDMFAMTAAHKTLPLPCYARVTNLANGRSVVVRINDRGPFVADRIIDLSYAAASKLGMLASGTAFVEVRALTPQAPPVPLPVNVPAAAAASAGVSDVPPVRAPPSVASPHTAPPRASSASPGYGLAGRFYIQVGAFAQPRHAQRAAARMRAAGLTPLLRSGGSGGHALLRVQVGPVDSVEQFDQLMARVRALGFSDARLAQGEN